MIIAATVPVTILASFLANLRNEGSKYHIGNIWKVDEHLNELWASLDEQLLKLSKTLERVDGSLSRSRFISDWLHELDQSLYEMEDIEESTILAGKVKIVTKFLQTNINYVKLMQNKLASINHELEAGLPDLDLECLPDAPLINRGEDMSKIIEKLKETNSYGVSITGMGGIGKTTLARAIAEEASIKLHFPCILNLPQSPNFNYKSAIDCIKDALKLQEKDRVLILLDGMESVVNPDHWVNFRLQCKAILHPESKVLITTQNPRVADVTGTSKYSLPPLLGEECFSLIHNLAGGNSSLDEENDFAIRHNKEKLVEACMGLPMLARQIGLLLAAEAPEDRLQKIAEITTTNLWEIEGLKRVLANLKPVSLMEQEPNLRRCVAYCSLFPRDYEFQEEDLVQLWMAEGFAPPSRGATRMEATMRGFFNELISYSLFQRLALRPDKKPRYKLHELFHDMALHVASKTYCHLYLGNSISSSHYSSINESTHHISLTSDYTGEMDTDHLLSYIQSMCSNLRTFLLLRESGKKINKNPTFFKTLTCLRVLDLSHTNLTKLEPKSISKLKNLRYLDLSYTPISKLPKLSKSPELQVLKLNHCDKLRCLPRDLTNLTNLISLQVFSWSLCSMPSRLGNLRSLKRLDVFIVGKQEGFNISELKNLNNLRNSLCIRQLENVKSKKEATEAMLHKKWNLERLELVWSRSAPNEFANQVLEGLKPPRNLTELIFRYYWGTKFPEWLSNTQVCGLLNSIHLKGCKALPSVEQLPLLKTLHLESMHPLQHGTNRRFPFVETLVLQDMVQLDRWIELAANCMPHLLKLQLDKCLGLFRLPELDCLKSLEKLEISSCPILEKLPTLPQSLKSLVILNSDKLERRCRVGEADWAKIKGIQVVIDSTSVDASEPDSATVALQSSSRTKLRSLLSCCFH